MATRATDLDAGLDLASEFGENASYVAELLARYRVSPASVDPEWQEYFRSRLGEPPAAAPAAVSAPAAAPPPSPATSPGPASSGAERAPLRGAALRVAENMEASLSVPTATSQRLVPIKLLDENRRLVNDYRTANDQSKVSFTHLVAWAILRALDAIPRLNDAFEDAGDAPVRIRREAVNFGLAVDVEKSDGSRALVVPNVKRANALGFGEFVAAADDLVRRARQGRLQISDFEGTTISLTNPGTLGTTASVPRLLPGQGAIIATGAIEYPAEFSAMAPETLSRLAISKVVTLTSTYDHRIIQGAESGLFLARVEELLLGKHEFYEQIFGDLGVPHKPMRWEVDESPGIGAENRTAEIAKQAKVLNLINAYRVRGHLIADIDPLRFRPVASHPELDLETYGLTIWDLDRKFWTGHLAGGDYMPLRDVIAVMHRVYCGKVGIEYRHLSSPEEKEWIRRRVGAPPEPLPASLRRKILEKLVAAEDFERFVGTRFLGQRRYSIEGCETTIPLLDRLVEESAARGVEEIVLGMSHRGRLNIMANVVGNAAERIFAGFQGAVHPDFPADEGDVKYHQGGRTERTTESGAVVAITVPSNPSHLEAVDPVVEGMVRAKQDRLGRGPHAWKRVLPLLLHGDAAFAGQGIVAETFNLAQLSGYRTGGTVHVVVNNQIGFTTPPSSGRSSQYSTDVAKINGIPIFHVNGDDPEAAYRVLVIALDYRQEFHKDVVIDLIGFRRHGHNEGDEPTYTQPVMYRKIAEHPGVRALYARRLAREGVVPPEEAEAMEARQVALYEQALAAAKGAASRAPAAAAPTRGEEHVVEIDTAVPAETLARIGRTLTTVPAGFHLNPKMVQQLARRAKMTRGELPLDWGTAEALAFGSLLLEGTAVRISGQDSSRGTFSQRHVVFHDAVTGEMWTPLSQLDPDQAPFAACDSPLSEMGVLGFEYGYSTEARNALVLWEAQFGDFANGAQVIIDQFISSAEDKWRETSRLTMLLPHGAEGQGPEHSSARIERYLQLCADGNLQVCNVTTPAQYFHVLRRQMREKAAKPLVLFTPKSLLRLPAAASPVAELAHGGFRAALGDSEADAGATRVLLCSGKVYYELKAEREKRGDRSTAILRVEQLYPFPADELAGLLGGFGRLADAAWVQEEPRNMGPYLFVRPLLEPLVPRGVALRYVGRPASASPATGNASVHKHETETFVAEAFG